MTIKNFHSPVIFGHKSQDVPNDAVHATNKLPTKAIWEFSDKVQLHYMSHIRFWFRCLCNVRNSIDSGLTFPPYRLTERMHFCCIVSLCLSNVIRRPLIFTLAPFFRFLERYRAPKSFDNNRSLSYHRQLECFYCQYDYQVRFIHTSSSHD